MSGIRLSQDLVLHNWWPTRQIITQLKAAGLLPKVRFEVCNAQGQRLQTGTAALQDLPRNLDCWIFLDASDIALLTTDLPKLTPRQLQEGLAFLVENQLISSPEDNWVRAHGQLGQAKEGRFTTLVSAVDKLLMRQVLSTLADTGLRVRAITAEPLVLAPKGHPVWLLCTEYEAWICTPSKAPWALPLTDPDQAKQLLTWWVQSYNSNRSTPLSEFVIIPINKQQIPTLEAIVGDRPIIWRERNQLKRSEQAAHLLPTLELKRAKVSGQSNNALFATVVALAVVLAVGWIIGLNAYAWRQTQRLAAVQAKIESAFNDAMPNTPMIADPVLLLERHKSELAKGIATDNTAGFSTLMHNAGQALSSLPSNSVDAAEYQSGKLTLIFNNTLTQEQKSAIEAMLKGQQMQAVWTMDDKKRARLRLSVGGTS